MAPRRAWAAVFAAGAQALPEPHPATAAATVGTLDIWSSVLPWRSCGEREPWHGRAHADRVTAAVAALRVRQPAQLLVWGGDWNHAMVGRDYVGSAAGRRVICDALAGFGLQVPTAELPHRLPGLVSIDHVAVPDGWEVTDARRVVAEQKDHRLSDHDMYIVDVSVNDAWPEPVPA